MAKEDRWLNRIVSNLLYYQTNYFVSALVIFALVSFAHPQHMVYGMSVMVRERSCFKKGTSKRAKQPKLKGDQT